MFYSVNVRCQALSGKNSDNVNFASSTRVDDSAKSKIDGRVAVASRTCPTVIVSAHPTAGEVSRYC